MKRELWIRPWVPLFVFEAALWASAARAADCNANGIDDAQDIAGRVSEDCNENSVPDECEIDPPAFRPTQPPLAVGDSPKVLETVDLDGDGDLDVVTGNRSGNQKWTSSVTVLLNEGQREFRRKADFPAGDHLYWLSSADLDRDGNNDLVLASELNVTLLLNEGDATFGAPRKIPLEQATEFIETADVDGDGWPDLVTAHPGAGSIAVFPNKQDGTFGPPVFLSSGRAVGVDVADLDGDGDADLIVAVRGSRFAPVFFQTAQGVFADRLNLDAGDARPQRVLAVDLDHHGGPDVVAVGNRSVSIFLNQGGGEFFPASVLWFTGSTNSATAADFDGDGDLDLAVGFLGDVRARVIVNGGDAFLPASSNLPRSRSVATGDFDGDGSPDLAALGDSDSLSVLWNETGGDEGPVLLDAPDDYPVTGEPHALALGDLDGDGDLDAVTPANHDGGLSIIRNYGDGSFAQSQHIFPELIAFWLVAADLDLDGDLDLATIDHDASSLAILENDGSGQFLDPERQEIGSNPYHIVATDLDRDGQVDLVIANRGSDTVTILHNTGEESALRFTSASVKTGGSPVAVAPADLDGDGWIDLAVAHEDPPAVTILGNAGDRSFVKLIELATIGTPNFVVAADLDRDGDSDLVIAERVRGAISVYFNHGRGTFQSSSVSVRREARSVTAADMDGDGYLDLITANETETEFSIFLNTRAGSFLFPYDYPVGGAVRSVLTGDLDADGDLDVVSANYSNHKVSVLLNRSTIFSGDFLREICTELDFSQISVASHGGGPIQRVGKFIAPALDNPALLPTVFQNVVRFPLHEDFLREVFWPDLSPGDYDNLVGRRRTREYFAGSLSRLRVDEERLYTFAILADTGLDPDETPRLEEVRRVYDELRQAFRLEPLAYGPDTELARQEAETWTDPPFPVFLGEQSTPMEYEPYTLGTTYGRVRLLAPDEFEALNRAGRFTFQDILVLDQVPSDIEGVVGGVITAATQAELSHLAIRTARRGTPNAYVSEALKAFAPVDGKLVRLEVLATEYRVEETSLEEAEAFWSQQGPRLSSLPEIDAEYGELDTLLEIDLSGASGLSPVSRHGGKATNMARMQRVLTGGFAKYREAGFSIPVRYYLEFLRANSVVTGGGVLTYGEYLESLLASPEFKSDSTVRFETLDRFRELVRDEGVVDPDLVSRLARRIEEVFGDTTRMVRFRSSSNVEDSLEFNGAGLYESTSVCAADTLDVATRTSSYCDPTRTNERTIERALKKVWSSLWTFRAHEERAFFQIPPERAAMGILVTRAFLDETVNGVAFTGNPLAPTDDRYVVAAQVGEESVVTPEPGISVERNLLEIVDGEVVAIARSRSSSLVAPGEHVLSDDQLRELGAFMSHVEGEFGREFEEYAADDVLLDFEFKIEPDGSLAVKQVRPFLAAIPEREAPVFEIVVPPGTTVCGVFSPERTGRGPREEYETKSVVRFHHGEYELSSARDVFSLDLIDEVVFGTGQQRAEPTSIGEVSVVRLADGTGGIIYRFVYNQEFRLPDGRSFAIQLSGLHFTTRDGVPTAGIRVFDEEFLTSQIAMEGALAGEPVVTYASCSYSSLPEWVVEVETADATRVSLTERFLPSENGLGTGPANVVRAEVSLGGEVRVVTDYWRLVYSARRHNRDIRYWVVLDPPLNVSALPAPVRVVEIEMGRRPEDRFVRYLDGEFEVLLEPAVVSFGKELAPQPVGPRFVRGDVTAEGRISILDSLSLSQYLFGGRDTLPCLKSADTNDSGRIDLADAILILSYLFGDGWTPAPPFPDCGVDGTDDDLSCESFPACP